TLDKMEAIPGYTTQPDNALFRKVTAEVGCAIIGQTANLAPADKRFYGVRDVTATVENVSLITASILSKKLAAGLGSLVLDVKCGNGAFMDNVDDAARLAQSLVDVANGAGTTTTAIITDMSQPLASAAGNAVEVVNAVRFLTGEARDARLLAVTVALVADMLVSAGIAADSAHGETMARATLDDGRAAELFGKMVDGLGGPADFVDRYAQHLPAAPLIVPILAPADGYVSAINTRGIGLAVVEMGGGRRSAEDTVDPAVGLTDLLPIGARVEAGQPIAMAHVRDDALAARAAQAVLAAYQITDEKPVDIPLIIRRISP
ncbi:MAG: thymidine phosphorylase, partial [Ahrensia sp.]